MGNTVGAGSFVIAASYDIIPVFFVVNGMKTVLPAYGNKGYGPVVSGMDTAQFAIRVIIGHPYSIPDIRQ